MKIGCCTSLFGDEILLLPRTGADYAEIGLSELAAHPPEEVAARGELLRRAGVACEAANLMFPGTFRLTGEQADCEAVIPYLEDVLEKAAALGIGVCVFGSGGPRAVPEGFPPARAWEQLKALCREILAPAFRKRGMICCIEPLNRRECNILTTCEESARLVREVGEDSVRLLVDLYHFDLEGESRESLKDCGELLAHSHIASAGNGRALPAEGEGEDYAGFFRILKETGYRGRASLEGRIDGDFLSCVTASVRYLRSLTD